MRIASSDRRLRATTIRLASDRGDRCSFRSGNYQSSAEFSRDKHRPGKRCTKEMDMPILLWLLGIPIPIIILLILFWH
jgi:hypothetical protein